MSPLWGVYEGGTTLFFSSNSFPCSSTSTSCCLTSLSLTCVFGGLLSTPANFNSTSRTIQCQTPRGISNTTVQVYLASNGKRIGMRNNAYFYYNSSINDFFNRSTFGMNSAGMSYNSPAYTCSSCLPYFPSTFCPVDCMNVIYGSAVFDRCGMCYNGSSSIRTPDLDVDCMGNCFGPYLYYDPIANAQYEQPRAGATQCVCDATNIARGICVYYAAQDGSMGLSAALDTLNAYKWFLLVVSATLILAAIMSHCLIWWKRGGWNSDIQGPMIYSVTLPPTAVERRVPSTHANQTRQTTHQRRTRVPQGLTGVTGGVEMTRPTTNHIQANTTQTPVQANQTNIPVESMHPAVASTAASTSSSVVPLSSSSSRPVTIHVSSTAFPSSSPSSHVTTHMSTRYGPQPIHIQRTT